MRRDSGCSPTTQEDLHATSRSRGRVDGIDQSASISGGERSQGSLLPGDRGVKLAGLWALRPQPRLEMRDGFGEDILELFHAGEVAGDALDLRVVEESRPRLVAHERPFPLRMVQDEGVSRHMNN